MTFKERYRFNPKTDLLGKGGFSKVYRATDTLRNMPVALKFYTSDGNDKYSLLNEIRHVINLEHPHICRYYDIVTLEGENQLGEYEKIEICILEYIDGGTIPEFLRKHPREPDLLLRDILKGLDFLHQNNLIHRDLKPSNILVKNTAAGPIAKITDFGISKSANSVTTRSSHIIGTIGYMAPEQLDPDKYSINGRIAPNVDLWYFGLLVYELVTGKNLFSKNEHTDTGKILQEILFTDVREALNKLPEPYKTITGLCLVKDANKRVQHVTEIVTAWDRLTDLTNEEKEAESPVSTKEIVSADIMLPDETRKLIIISTPDKETPAKKKVSLLAFDKRKLPFRAMAIVIASVIALLLLLKFFSGINNDALIKAGIGDTEATSTELVPVKDSSGKWKFVNSNGEQEMPFQCDYADTFFDWRARVVINHKFGVINKDYRLIADTLYDFIGRFENEIALCIIFSEEASRKSKYGFIDFSGKQVIPCMYQQARQFREDRAAVRYDNKWGFLNEAGVIVAPLIYDRVNDFSEGIAIIVKNGKYGGIDREGKGIIPCIYDSAGDFSEGLAAVYKNNKLGFINQSGKEVISIQYDYRKGWFKGGLAYVEKEGKGGFVNKNGNVVIPLRYHDGSGFREGLAAVCLDDKCGFIDSTGREIIPFLYQDAFPFLEGFATVKRNNKFSFINKSGQTINDFTFDNTLCYFTDGAVAVAIQNKWGFIDTTGRIIVQAKYQKVKDFHEGLAAVQEKGLWGCIDKAGNLLAPCQYELFGEFSQGLATVTKNGKTGLIDKTGKEITRF
jgi:serine/threonine protein kinase